MIVLYPVEFVVELSDSQKVHEIMEYPLNDIRDRVLKEGSVAEGLVDTAIAEYRKFMSLLALGNRRLAMCSKDVDEIWHNHILFTRDYANFCQSIFGDFVHHIPATASEPMAADSVDRFYRAYQRVFGPVDPIWNTQYFPCFMKDACGGIPQGCGDCGGECVDDDKKSNK